MDSINVHEGEKIEQGHEIGIIGETGFATGEHLHWEMRVSATPVTPNVFLNRPLLDINALMSRM